MLSRTANSFKIAILLATYNGEQFLGDQVRSLLAQQNVEVHVFARDDGSTDGTINLLKSLQAANPSRITLVTDAAGPTGSAATNFFALLRGVNFDDYDYVAFSDQDDIWLPTKLERAVQCIRGQAGGGYSSNLLAWNEDCGATWVLDKGGQPKSLDYLFQGASAGCTYVLDRFSAALAQRRLQQLTQPNCEGISHDWVVHAICRSAGFRWFYDDDIHIRYRQHSTNVYGALPGVKGMIARMRLMRAGWYKAHILWLSNVIENHPEETAILSAMKRGSLSDRLMFICNAGNFRRTRGAVWKLRFAFAAGFFR